MSKENPFRTQWDIALYDQDTMENIWQSDDIENAYDAFWLADEVVSGAKSLDDIQPLLRSQPPDSLR